MPDTNKIEESRSEIQDRLASLGEQFNTTQQFGLMGMLEQEKQKIADLQRGNTQPPAEVQTQAPATQEDSDSPPKWLDPLTQSLRGIADTTTREIGSIRNEIQSIRQQPIVQATQEEAGEIDPLAQKLGSMEQVLQKNRLDTAWERAKNALNSAKMRHGDDFDFKENDLRDAWRQHIGGNVQAAESTNWDVYMQQQYDSRRAPKLESRLKALEGELARQKAAPATRDTASDLAAVPRANRNGAPPAASSGIQGDFDEDVYRRANARMGKRIGSFAGFNRLLVEEQNKKLLRTAG